MMLLLPLIILVLGAYIAFAIGRFGNKDSNSPAMITALFSFMALLVSGFLAMALVDFFNAGLNFTLADINASTLDFMGFSAADILTYSVGSTDFILEPLGAFLMLVATGLTFVVSIYSIGYMKDASRKVYFYPLFLLMVAGIVGIAISTDLFMMYVFFELMCISSYALVAFNKGKWESIEAGMKYLVLSTGGSAFALFGIALIYGQFHTLDMFEIMTAGATTGPMSSVAVIMLIIGFGVKAAIVPLHTWLPDAHSAAPSNISAMLSGIVIETGIIILIKNLIIFQGAINFGELLVILAIATMTVGNMMAFIQLAVKGADLKRILAYSSIAQVGYILLGLGLGFAYGAEMGFRGGVFHIMTHAFMKGLAFLAAGAIIYRLGTRDIKKMRGIGHVMPITALAFTIAALSLSGAPPLSGFMSEWMIFKAGVDVVPAIGFWGIIISVILLLNSALSLGYYLPIIKGFFLKPRMKFVGITEAPAMMLIPIILLTAITITLGIWPELGLQFVAPVVDYLMGLGGGVI